jgi:FkbM family methyltransferase
MPNPNPESRVCDGAYGTFEGSSQDRVVMDEYCRLGSWAPELVSLIVGRLFAGRAGTFIDIGANIGLVSIPVVERSGSLGIAFEPEPRNFGFLTRNVARHGLSERMECHQLACHRASGWLDLALSPDNLGDHRLRPPAAEGGTPPLADGGNPPLADGGNPPLSDGGNPPPGTAARQTIRVATTRLDDLLRERELARPIVMKVDVQGSEVSVFRGALETLARADFVVSEYWPAGIVAHGDSAATFADIMRGFQFGAVLHVLPLPEPLHSAQYVFEQLSWIANDGSDPGFFDLLFSRHWELPTAPP